MGREEGSFRSQGLVERDSGLSSADASDIALRREERLGLFRGYQSLEDAL